MQTVTQSHTATEKNELAARYLRYGVQLTFIDDVVDSAWERTAFQLAEMIVSEPDLRRLFFSLTQRHSRFEVAVHCGPQIDGKMMTLTDGVLDVFRYDPAKAALIHKHISRQLCDFLAQKKSLA